VAVVPQVERWRPALFLSRQALRREARPQVADRQDALSVAFAVLRHGAGLPLRPLAPECRSADVQVRCRDLAAKYSHYHPRDPDSRPACALGVDHVPVEAAMDGKRVAVARSRRVLQPGWLSRLGTEVARLVYLCRVQMAKATGLLLQEALP